MNSSYRHIAVLTGDHRLTDSTKRNARFNEEDVKTHEAMKEAFRSLTDFTFEFLDNHESLLERLRTHPPDLAVNFCDTGFRNQATRELNIPAYLELLGIPYTGAPPAAMVMCYDKAMARLVAQAHGISVPQEYFLGVKPLPNTLPIGFPALIKPNTADGSVGITKDAVVRSFRDTEEYVSWLWSTLPGCDVLLQEYLPGPEYGIGVIGNIETELRFLPTLEVDFSSLPKSLNPILSFESKAHPDSPYWTDIRFKKANLPQGVETKMQDAVRTLFKRFGLRDYARFDFRVGSDGEPKLMEVNPNPAWANDGKLAFMAGFAGLDYREMLHSILKAAITRLTTRPS